MTLACSHMPAVTAAEWVRYWSTIPIPILYRYFGISTDFKASRGMERYRKATKMLDSYNMNSSLLVYEYFLLRTSTERGLLFRKAVGIYKGSTEKKLLFFYNEMCFHSTRRGIETQKNHPIGISIETCPTILNPTAEESKFDSQQFIQKPKWPNYNFSWFDLACHSP